jgi:hypothetical protein
MDHEIAFSSPGAATVIADLETIYSLMIQIRTLQGNVGGLAGGGFRGRGFAGEGVGGGQSRRKSRGSLLNDIGTASNVARLSELGSKIIGETSGMGNQVSQAAALRRGRRALSELGIPKGMQNPYAQAMKNLHFGNIMANQYITYKAEQEMLDVTAQLYAGNRSEGIFRTEALMQYGNPKSTASLWSTLSHIKKPGAKSAFRMGRTLLRNALLGSSSASSATWRQLGVRIAGRTMPVIGTAMVAWDLFYKSADDRMKEKWEAERQNKVGELREVAVVRGHHGDPYLQHHRIMYAQQEARKIGKSMGVTDRQANQAWAQAEARYQWADYNWDNVRQMARAAAKSNKPDEAAAKELAKIRGWDVKKPVRPEEYIRPVKGGV